MRKEPTLTPEEIAEKMPPAAVFSELERVPLRELVEEAAGATTLETQRALAESPLSLAGAATLLRSPRADILSQILDQASALTRERFGRRLVLYAPCYLSSFCVNHCVYCGFNFGMSIPRRFLTPDQALEEISFLSARGMKKILLVAGEYPSKVTSDYLAEVIRRSRSLVPELDLEVGPVRKADYRKWVQAGAGGVVCYQETYDWVQYARLHPRGPKLFYEHRLGTPERAGAAGMKRLGLGILLGLAEPIRDLLALITHVRFLETAFPGVALTVSLPRLRPAAPSFRPEYVVDDASLLRFYAVLRLALPRTGLVVSTRERANLRESLLEAGITQLSAGSVTVPGGYGSGERDAGQFEIADHRSVAEVVSGLQKRGFSIGWTSHPDLTP